MPDLKSYIVAVMKDREKGPGAFAVGFLLYAVSIVYAAGQFLVDCCYRSGLRKTFKTRVPVISVGNITLGGTGKTPFSIFLAEYLLNRGRRPAVLTRGYGADENRMTKEELAEVPVYVGQDRVASARKAVSEGRDVLIMDDGFQHRRLERDLNIVLVDGVSGFGNGVLFPRGVLRERLPAMKRADMVVLTKADMAGEERLRKLKKKISGLRPGTGFVTAVHKPLFLTDTAGAGYETCFLEGKRVCAVCGIADPEYFNYLLEEAGATVVSRLFFGDHHAYSPRDIAVIARTVSANGAEAVVTTGKDYVKLRHLPAVPFEDRLYVLNVVIDLKQGKEILFAGLDNILSG